MTLLDGLSVKKHDVMIYFFSLSFFFSGKTYKPIDFVACISMSVGLILFTLADSTVQPEFNHTGKFCSQ